MRDVGSGAPSRLSTPVPFAFMVERGAAKGAGAGEQWGIVGETASLSLKFALGG